MTAEVNEWGEVDYNSVRELEIVLLERHETLKELLCTAGYRRRCSRTVLKSTLGPKR